MSWISLGDAVQLLCDEGFGLQESRRSILQGLYDEELVGRACTLKRFERVSPEALAPLSEATDGDPLRAAIIGVPITTSSMPIIAQAQEHDVDLSPHLFGPPHLWDQTAYALTPELQDFWRRGRLTLTDPSDPEQRTVLNGIMIGAAALRSLVGGDSAAQLITDLVTGSRVATDQEVRDFGDRAVEADFGIGRAEEAVRDLWNPALHPLKRDDARNAIRAAQLRRGEARSRGRPRKSANVPGSPSD